MWVLIVFAPLVWGGRGEIAQAVYAAVVAVMSVAWLLHQYVTGRSDWKWTPLYWIPVAAFAWVLFQLLPLPAGVVEFLSPRTAELLPLWQNEGWLAQNGLSEWTCLSLTPVSGQVSLAMLLCFTLVVIVAIARFKSHQQASQLMKWLAQSAALMAGFGVLQYLTADGRFFWVYEHPFRGTDDYACGSFINHNHFASFLVMGAAAIVYQIVRVKPVKSKPLPGQSQLAILLTKSNLSMFGWVASLALVVIALQFAASRGGLLALLSASATMVFVNWRKRLLGRRQLLWTLLVVVLAMVGIGLQGEDRFTDRLSDLASGSMDKLDRIGARRAIWQANVRAISDGWLVGSGAGSHADVYSAYLDRTHPKVFTHAENGYLQLFTELGVPGVLLLGAVVACVWQWTRRAWPRCNDRDQAAMLAAVLGGIVASAVHSLTDFVWYIPATCIMALLLVVVLRRLALGDEPKPSANEKAAGPPLELAAAVLCMLIFMGVVLAKPAMASGAWHRYLLAAAAEERRKPSTLYDIAQTGDLRELELDRSLLNRKIEALRQVVQLDPSNSEAHLRLARGYLQLFDARAPERENRMVLGHLQSVAATGGFSSPDQFKEWLSRAVGPDLAYLEAATKHARASVRLCPLQGDGYVCLASTAFVDGRQIEPLLTQADRLAPYNGAVLFEIGKQYMGANQIEPAIDYWVRCSRQTGPHRLLVVAAMAGNIPSVDYLDTFQPDWQTLLLVWKRYYQAGHMEQLPPLLQYARQRADEYSPGPEEVRQAYVWVWLGHMYEQAGDQAQQLDCLERAMKLDPLKVAVRKNYAIALYQSGKFAECEPHLRWCLARDSTDQNLRKLLHQATSSKYRREVNFSTTSRLRIHPQR